MEELIVEGEAILVQYIQLCKEISSILSCKSNELYQIITLHDWEKLLKLFNRTFPYLPIDIERQPYYLSFLSLRPIFTKTFQPLYDLFYRMQIYRRDVLLFLEPFLQHNKNVAFSTSMDVFALMFRIFTTYIRLHILWTESFPSILSIGEIKSLFNIFQYYLPLQEKDIQYNQISEYILRYTEKSPFIAMKEDFQSQTKTNFLALLLSTKEIYLRGFDTDQLRNDHFFEIERYYQKGKVNTENTTPIAWIEQYYFPLLYDTILLSALVFPDSIFIDEFFTIFPLAAERCLILPLAKNIVIPYHDLLYKAVNSNEKKTKEILKHMCKSAVRHGNLYHQQRVSYWKWCLQHILHLFIHSSSNLNLSLFDMIWTMLTNASFEIKWQYYHSQASLSTRIKSKDAHKLEIYPTPPFYTLLPCFYAVIKRCLALHPQMYEIIQQNAKENLIKIADLCEEFMKTQNCIDPRVKQLILSIGDPAQATDHSLAVKWHRLVTYFTCADNPLPMPLYQLMNQLLFRLLYVSKDLISRYLQYDEIFLYEDYTHKIFENGLHKPESCTGVVSLLYLAYEQPNDEMKTAKLETFLTLIQHSIYKLMIDAYLQNIHLQQKSSVYTAEEKTSSSFSSFIKQNLAFKRVNDGGENGQPPSESRYHLELLCSSLYSHMETENQYDCRNLIENSISKVMSEYFIQMEKMVKQYNLNAKEIGNKKGQSNEQPLRPFEILDDLKTILAIQTSLRHLTAMKTPDYISHVIERCQQILQNLE